MNGCVIPHTPISVDCWRTRQYPNAQVFFLTHLHGDHIAGLTPTWSLPIYCTLITKKLLVHKLQICADLINALETNESHTVWLDAEEREMMTVTVLDAQHCPGSAMFLFQGYFGTILHTGDFRYSDKMFIDTPLSQPLSVDVLYLDNTYSSPECEFPTRRQAMEEIFEILDDHPDHDVLVGMRSLGKEDLLVAMALHVRTWVVVSQEQYEVLSILKMPNVFTTDPEAGYIHVVPMMRTSSTLYRWSGQRPAIAIIPTSLHHGSSNKYGAVQNLYVVPYSDHSCYSQLQQFVEKVRPKRIVPIVSGMSRGPDGKDISGRADMTCYRKYMDPQDVAPFEIPRTVEAFMTRCNTIGVKRSKKRKRSNLHAAITKMRRAYYKQGVKFEEDDDSEEHTGRHNGVDTNATDLSETTKPQQKADKWCLLPIYIPKDQQRSVWKSIADPHTYFQTKSNANDTLSPGNVYIERQNSGEGDARGTTIEHTKDVDLFVSTASSPTNGLVLVENGVISDEECCTPSTGTLVNTIKLKLKYQQIIHDSNSKLTKDSEISKSILTSNIPSLTHSNISLEEVGSLRESPASTQLLYRASDNVSSSSKEQDSENTACTKELGCKPDYEKTIQCNENGQCSSSSTDPQCSSSSTDPHVTASYTAVAKPHSTEGMAHGEIADIARNKESNATCVDTLITGSFQTNASAPDQSQTAVNVNSLEQNVMQILIEDHNLTEKPEATYDSQIQSQQIRIDPVGLELSNDDQRIAVKEKMITSGHLDLCTVDNGIILSSFGSVSDQSNFSDICSLPQRTCAVLKNLDLNGATKKNLLEQKCVLSDMVEIDNTGNFPLVQQHPIVSNANMGVPDKQQTDLASSDLLLRELKDVSHTSVSILPFNFCQTSTITADLSQAIKQGDILQTVPTTSDEPADTILPGDNLCNVNVQVKPSATHNTVYTIDVNTLNSLLNDYSASSEKLLIPANDQEAGTEQEQTVTFTIADSAETGETTNALPASLIIDPAIAAKGPEAVSKGLSCLTSDLMDRINETVQNTCRFNEDQDHVFALNDGISPSEIIADSEELGTNGSDSEYVSPTNTMTNYSDGTSIRQYSVALQNKASDTEKYFVWGPTSGHSSWQMRGKKRIYDPRRILLEECVDLPGGLALAGTDFCSSDQHKQKNTGEHKHTRKKHRGWPKGKPRGPRKKPIMPAVKRAKSNKAMRLVIKLEKAPKNLLHKNEHLNENHDRIYHINKTETMGIHKVSETIDAPPSPENQNILEMLAEICPSWSTDYGVPVSDATDMSNLHASVDNRIPAIPNGNGHAQSNYITAPSEIPHDIYTTKNSIIQVSPTYIEDPANCKMQTASERLECEKEQFGERGNNIPCLELNLKKKDIGSLDTTECDGNDSQIDEHTYTNKELPTNEQQCDLIEEAMQDARHEDTDVTMSEGSKTHSAESVTIDHSTQAALVYASSPLPSLVNTPSTPPYFVHASSPTPMLGVSSPMTSTPCIPILKAASPIQTSALSLPTYLASAAPPSPFLDTVYSTLPSRLDMAVATPLPLPHTAPSPTHLSSVPSPPLLQVTVSSTLPPVCSTPSIPLRQGSVTSMPSQRASGASKPPSTSSSACFNILPKASSLIIHSNETSSGAECLVNNSDIRVRPDINGTPLKVYRYQHGGFQRSTHQPTRTSCDQESRTDTTDVVVDSGNEGNLASNAMVSVDEIKNEDEQCHSKICNSKKRNCDDFDLAEYKAEKSCLKSNGNRTGGDNNGCKTASDPAIEGCVLKTLTDLQKLDTEEVTALGSIDHSEGRLQTMYDRSSMCNVISCDHPSRIQFTEESKARMTELSFSKVVRTFGGDCLNEERNEDIFITGDCLEGILAVKNRQRVKNSSPWKDSSSPHSSILLDQSKRLPSLNTNSSDSPVQNIIDIVHVEVAPHVKSQGSICAKRQNKKVLHKQTSILGYRDSIKSKPDEYAQDSVVPESFSSPMNSMSKMILPANDRQRMLRRGSEDDCQAMFPTQSAITTDTSNGDSFIQPDNLEFVSVKSTETSGTLLKDNCKCKMCTKNNEVPFAVRLLSSHDQPDIGIKRFRVNSRRTSRRINLRRRNLGRKWIPNKSLGIDRPGTGVAMLETEKENLTLPKDAEQVASMSELSKHKIAVAEMDKQAVVLPETVTDIIAMTGHRGKRAAMQKTKEPEVSTPINRKKHRISVVLTDGQILDVLGATP